MNMPSAGGPGPYVIHDGLAVCRFGSGEPVFLMPGPHRFQKPGDRTADTPIGIGWQGNWTMPPAWARSRCRP
jgi:hypothetical protein